MKNRTVLITITVLALIVASVAVLLLRDKESQAPAVTSSSSQTSQGTIDQTSPEPTAPSVGDEQQPPNAQPGEYVDYSEAALTTPNTKLLFFHAPWCPQCRALENDIWSKGVPSGVTIVKVDYDSRQDLRQRYGVTLQTSIVRIADDGSLVEKFVAYDDPSLNAVVNELL